MSYALVINGAVARYPYSLATLRADNPQVSFPRELDDAKLAEWGVLAVQPTAKPSYNEAKNIVEGTPALNGGAWVQTWAEVDASAEEIAARQEMAANMAAVAAAKADAFVAQFVAMTPAQVAAYVEANVTSLATAKALLGKMALMMLRLARREYR